MARVTRTTSLSGRRSRKRVSLDLGAGSSLPPPLVAPRPGQRSCPGHPRLPTIEWLGSLIIVTGAERMTIEQLRAAHRAKPFRPFTVRIADGRSFLVHHPDFL